MYKVTEISMMKKMYDHLFVETEHERLIVFDLMEKKLFMVKKRMHAITSDFRCQKPLEDIIQCSTFHKKLKRNACTKETTSITIEFRTV